VIDVGSEEQVLVYYIRFLGTCRVVERKRMVKSKALKCEKCGAPARFSGFNRRLKPFKHKMKRLYVKNRMRSWSSIGWVCFHCGDLVLDDKVKVAIVQRQKEIEMILDQLR
jgi:Fe-S oxidoreductase